MAIISIGHAVALLCVELSDATTTGHILSLLGWVLILVCAVLAAESGKSASEINWALTPGIRPLADPAPAVTSLLLLVQRRRAPADPIRQ